MTSHVVFSSVPRMNAAAIVWIFACIIASLPSLYVRAQDVVGDIDAEMVELNFGDEVELTVLVDLLARRLDMNILYDEQLRGKRVTLKTPAKLPRSSLLTLLESALRMKGFALVDGEDPGWKKIVPVRGLIDIAGDPDAADANDAPEPRPTQAVTRVFRLEHTKPDAVDPVVRPFLTQPGGNAMSLPDRGLLIVTDYQENMGRIAQLISLADRPGPAIVVKFVEAKHLDASALAERVRGLLQTKQRLAGQDPAAEARIEVSHDERTNQVILLGEAGSVAEAEAAIGAFDVDLGLKTVVYQLGSVPPERIERLARELLDPEGSGRTLRTSVDAEAGFLVVTTTEANHTQIRDLKDSLDIPLAEDQNPVRFYKLENASAAEVLAIIQSLEGGTGLADVDVAPNQAQGDTSNRGVTRYSPPDPPEVDAAEAGTVPGRDQNLVGETNTGTLSGVTPGVLRPVEQALQSQRANVTADPNTNSIIVVAEPAVQHVFEHLIGMLDRRRPQVMVEVTLVAIDTSDGFSLGVELRREEEWSDGQALLFSSFGLSEVDGDGEFALSPSIGFNGVAVDADIGEIVLKALKTDGNTRVLSEPKLLVNDNATGTLASVAEAPFSSVNASDTVATTSFGGFVEAGTTISVAPQISEGDHIILSYDIALNSFGEGGGDDLPPPRQTNSLKSIVTIPDGQMIIVGGLNRTDESLTKQSIPVLGSIPGVEFLFSNRTKNQSETTLFAFIRPVILRDDQFEDLKYLSAVDRRDAGLPDAYPSSAPLLVK